MFTNRFEIMRLFGFPIRLDLSWVVIATLVTWSLGSGYFPGMIAGLSPGAYLLMGLAGALGLFASIVLHELAHALVARAQGIPIGGITLFIFGGVAEMQKEPPSPRSELLMALAGPGLSLVLSGLFQGLALIGQAVGVPASLLAIAFYLAGINLLLAVFNMIPAFPLDGGRVLRAVLWGKWNDMRRATRVTAAMGEGFGMLLIALGVWSVLGGSGASGVWFALIGLFIRHAAKSSYEHLVAQEALGGAQIGRFMSVNPVTVPPHATLAAMVERVFTRHTHKMYPVVEDGRLVGCVTLRAVQSVPRGERDRKTVADVMDAPGPGNMVAAEAEALEAVAAMGREGATRLMVVEGNALVGVVSVRDLLETISIRLRLGEPGP